jgi:hypothetical protein
MDKPLEPSLMFPYLEPTKEESCLQIAKSNVYGQGKDRELAPGLTHKETSLVCLNMARYMLLSVVLERCSNWVGSCFILETLGLNVRACDRQTLFLICSEWQRKKV